MILEEPRVEFIQIVPSNSIATSTGGGQYCIGSQVDAAYCPGWVDEVDWSIISTVDVDPTSTPLPKTEYVQAPQDGSGRQGGGFGKLHHN